TGALRIWEIYSSPWYNHPIGSDRLWKAYWVWDTLCDDLVERYGTDRPLAASFFIILVVVAAVLILTARKLHAAMLLALVAVTLGVALAIGHDWDATFLGLAGGLLFAISLAGCGRRKRDP